MTLLLSSSPPGFCVILMTFVAAMFLSHSQSMRTVFSCFRMLQTDSITGPQTNGRSLLLQSAIAGDPTH